MEEEKLADALSKTTGLSKEDIRALIREESDRKEKEKQDECSHSRSADLIDTKKGIIRCNDCGKMGTKDDFGDSPTEIPPRMQTQIDELMKRRDEK